MTDLHYVKLTDIHAEDFVPLLNNPKIRRHLIEHPQFDTESIQEWLNTKIAMDARAGCQIRAVFYRGRLVGWCGIQWENEQYEIAIILDPKRWGLGKRVFHDMMHWAKALGHEIISIHLLDTRPNSKFLRSIANEVLESQFLGHRFLTYQLSVK